MVREGQINFVEMVSTVNCYHNCKLLVENVTSYRNKRGDSLNREWVNNCYHKNVKAVVNRIFVTLSGVAIQNQQKVKVLMLKKIPIHLKKSTKVQRNRQKSTNFP